MAARCTTFLAIGFRPFFLGAAVFGGVSMAWWFALYTLGWNLGVGHGAPLLWHAHEMVFGYTGAVIAGFLLTAVPNWTGLPTFSGAPLAVLAVLWLAARILGVFPGPAPVLAGFFDTGFYLLLVAAITAPIVRAGNWSNLGVLTKVVLILLSHVLYSLGQAGMVTDGVLLGLYSGFYLVVGLVLMMCRRLIPFFTERGVGYPVKLRNSRLLDHAALVLFFAFWLAEVLARGHPAGAILAGLLAVVHVARWIGWHTPGIWVNPLLWVLWIGYGGLISGFVLRALQPLLSISGYLPLHAFAVGGVGVVTVGMMARVTLGHTGRDVRHPPRVIAAIFVLVVLAAVARVLLPLMDMTHYPLWIGGSQVLWIIAFGWFAVIYTPMLVRPRIDRATG